MVCSVVGISLLGFWFIKFTTWNVLVHWVLDANVFDDFCSETENIVIFVPKAMIWEAWCLHFCIQGPILVPGGTLDDLGSSRKLARGSGIGFLVISE